MVSDPAVHPTSSKVYQSVVPQLLELCSGYDLDAGMIERSQDLDELLDRILEQYEQRLDALRSQTFGAAAARGTPDRLRALTAFARQAVSLDRGAELAGELRRRLEELERLNAAIERALRDESRSSERVDRVLAGLDEGLRAARRGMPQSNELPERHRREKLESLFQALAVLSHKINNPLTALMGRAQILQIKKGTDPHVSRAADVIEESAKRIASYVRELVQVVREGREELLEPPSGVAPAKLPEQEGQHEGED